MIPPTTQPQQRELPEAIETAVTRLVDAAYEDAREMFNHPVDWDAEHDDHLVRERAIVVAAIARELDAGRADTKRLDDWERERLILTPAARDGFIVYDRTGVDILGEGSTLRAAIDDATRKENQNPAPCSANNDGDDDGK